MTNAYIHRQIDNELLVWSKTQDHKPLLIRGARQVGKSSSVRKLSESGNLLWDWMENALTKGLNFVNDVIKTIKNHVEGVVNALITRTDSGKHENMNGRIQAILAKAKGFNNFERFRINVLFYFGKLDIDPLKFY